MSVSSIIDTALDRGIVLVTGTSDSWFAATSPAGLPILHAWTARA